MDSQEAEDVVRVDPEKVPVDPERTWTNAILATVTPRDHAVPDEAICEVLDAVANGAPLGELLAARSISLPTYCVWKAKYRQMSLEQVRAARRRERWRSRGLLAGVLVVAIAVGIGIVLGVTRAVKSQVAGATGTVRAGYDANSSTSPAPASNPPRPEPGPASPGDAPHAASTPLPAATDASSTRETAKTEVKPISLEGRAGTEAPSAIVGPGYKIQVAAANSEQEGRAIVDRLAQAGYRAYMLGVAVNNAEVFRVRVGPFETLESAQEIAVKLRQDGYRDAWITR